MSSDGYDDTLPQGSADTVADERGEPAARGEPSSLSRYELGAVIGRGGMGEVVEALDPHIGRSIAVKRMHGAPSADATGRFLREARIQARLDHPAIVPVYELVHDRDSKPYFTMKKLAGTTLHDVLERGDRTQQELLRAFVDVCRAIDFVHHRGFVHRDLKPQNVMLGDFGEVYVLDWGVARVVGRHDAPGAAAITTLEGQTQAGALLGTPGYMAPEQVRGDGDVGPPADVYALGCILFEVLAGEPAHPRGSRALATTLAPPTPLQPAARRPDRAIAPELDLACAAALAGDPADRPTARALADRVQAYLDGDRDVERRRALAAEHVTRARAALASGDTERRADAMRAAGYALVLDPASSDAAAIVMQLVLEPPRQMPDELARELARVEDDHTVRSMRFTAFGYLSFVLFVPLLAWNGVVDTGFLMVLFAAIVAAGAFNWWLTTGAPRRARIATYAVNSVLLVPIAHVFGPLLLAPAVAVLFAMGMSTQPLAIRRTWLVPTLVGAAWLGAIALELFGVVEPSFRVVDGAIELRSSVVRSDSLRFVAVLVAGVLMTIVASSLFARAVAASRHDAQRRVAVQAWHLRKMLPE
jgi:serine/threonine-protein kinase